MRNAAFLWGLCACALAACSRAASPAPAPPPPVAPAAPAEGLRVPLETYDNGQVKVQIVAARAQVQTGGVVVASDVRIELYQPDGTLEGTAVTPACRCDRAGGTATSDDEVRLDRQGLVVSGTGFDWNARKQTVTIRADAKVILPRNMRPLFPARPKAKLLAGEAAAGQAPAPKRPKESGRRND